MSRPKFLLVALAAATGLFAVAGSLPASTPPTGALTVPTTVGQTATDAWTGTIPIGQNQNSDCSQSAPAQRDEHGLTITVPANAYSAVRATFEFKLTWTPTSPNAQTSDEILTLIGPDGLMLNSVDGSATTETMTIENLPTGTYTVLACGFLNAVAQPYSASATITTTDPDPVVPAAPAQGLEFSASVAADNQRDEAEPVVEIDRAGNIYACGPSGFSQAADYLQVSTDGGDQFHLIGIAPRGQHSAAGGGDCTIAFGHQPNSRGHFDYAYSGLGALSGFSTSISPNVGHSIATGGFDLNGGVTNQGGVADRQWETFVSETDVLLIYNLQQPRNTVVLRSTDKGLTFNPATGVIGAASPRYPGPIRYDDAHDLVYFAWDDQGGGGDYVNLSISKDKGLTWFACRVDNVPGTVSLFPSADHDSDGNIYVGYGDGVSFETYMKVLPRENIDKCNKPATTTAGFLTDPGFGPRIRVDRDKVRTTLFPWITAGGVPGRAAIMFLGTETQGNPNVGTFRASWHAYVNVTTNALSTDPANPPTFSQVKATTHPMHYDSICINGLNCDLAIPPGDRSMADFMAVDYNPVTDKLTVVFNRTNKRPNEPVGHVGSTMAATQIGGPTLGGKKLKVKRKVLRKSSTDPTGDALSSWSAMQPLTVPPDPATTNEPAADFLSVAVGQEIDLLTGDALPNGGVTLTMKVADLSDAALEATLARTGSQSLLWLFRFTNGHQDAAASARWNPNDGFTFGYNDYLTGSAPCEPTGPSEGDKCILYPGDQPIQGDVNQATGTIRLSVPRFLLKALKGGTGHLQRPSEVAAKVGSRFYDGTAWSLGNTTSPTQEAQTFLYPFDNTPSMDFTLPSGGSITPVDGCTVRGTGALSRDRKFSLTVHDELIGNVSYRDKAEGVDFHSSSIGTLTCNGKAATVTGAGADGGDPVDFIVEVSDNRVGTADTFSIELSNGYSRSGNLSSGDITVQE